MFSKFESAEAINQWQTNHKRVEKPEKVKSSKSGKQPRRTRKPKDGTDMKQDR